MIVVTDTHFKLYREYFQFSILKFININNVIYTKFDDYQTNRFCIMFHFSSKDFTILIYDNEKDREYDFNKINFAYDAGYKILYL